MTTYFYKATDNAGKVIEGSVEAADHRVAVQAVRKMKYFPIRIAAEKPAKSISIGLKLPGGGRSKVSANELLSFTQQLATLVASGMTLDQSLTTSVQLTEKDSTKEILADVQNRVHGGSAFADALAFHPGVFSKLYVSMIRAGEVGGVLETVLFRLAEFMEKAEDLKEKMLIAMIYPIILIVVSGAAVVFLMNFVIPKFSGIFENMGNALPLPTVMLLAVTNFTSDYWWAILLAVLGISSGLYIHLSSEHGKQQWDRLALRLPILGDLIRKIEVSRFSRTMSTLQSSGVPVLQSLEIVRSIINNSAIAAAMNDLHNSLKSGKGMSIALRKSDVFPPLAVHMITVGEETGKMEDMLNRVSDTFDKEVENALKRIMALSEPLVIIIMAGFIGFIVVGMLLGMLSANDMAF